MAPNTRYQPVPSDEPLLESSYAQPPPSYQADSDPLAPRTEDDNLPDDFKVGLDPVASPNAVGGGEASGCEWHD